MAELSRQLTGFRLTTAEIIYRLPDHPALLQTYLWQEYDLSPKFPVLKRFLGWWEENLEGRLHQVHIAVQDHISPGHLKPVNFELNLH